MVRYVARVCLRLRNAVSELSVIRKDWRRIR